MRTYECYILNYFAVTHVHDVATLVLEILTITELRVMSESSRRLRAMVGAVIRRRFHRLLLPFVGPSLDEFIHILSYCDGVLTGSVARFMITGDCGALPGDLNIVVPYQSFRFIDTFIKHELGYVTVSKVAHPAITHAVCRFRKYACDHRTITTSAPRPSQSVLQVVLNSPTTADMVLMTAGGVSWFYPQWFQDKLAIQTRSSDIVSLDHGLGYTGKQEMMLAPDLQFTGRACGRYCPTLWHHIDDTSFRSFVDWNVEDTIKDVFGSVDMEWRLSPECTNTWCRYRIEVMARNLHFNGAFSCTHLLFMKMMRRRSLTHLATQLKMSNIYPRK